MKLQSLRELHKITEYKSGCVYKTQRVGDVWIDIDPEPKPAPDHMFVSLSTKRSMSLGAKGTMRRVPSDTPSIVEIW